MMLADLFLSARGRIARRPFWLGMLAMLAVVLVANGAAALHDVKAVAATPPPQWYRVGAFLVMAAPAVLRAGTPDIDNLYARFGTGAPYLLFAGHTDVVPPGDEAAVDARSLCGRGRRRR
jgi:acetylornithine deacetylase/succinyl-diaminopimelate desuccinylase-like protein